MLSGNLPNNGNVWQTTEPVKLENKGTSNDKHYWLTSFGKHLGFLLSKFKLSTSSFTHRPSVTKAHTTLHVHVRTLTQYSYTISYARLLSKLTPGYNRYSY